DLCKKVQSKDSSLRTGLTEYSSDSDILPSGICIRTLMGMLRVFAPLLHSRLVSEGKSLKCRDCTITCFEKKLSNHVRTVSSTNLPFSKTSSKSRTCKMSKLIKI